jgi:hypothetical protein
MNISIILNKKEGRIELLYNGYNIIKETIYNEELTNKIISLIEKELCVENLEKFLEE